MSGPTSLSWFVVWVCFLVRVSGGETEKTAKPGESVVLPCEAEKDVEHVEWRRGTDTVCTSQNTETVNCVVQSPSFENRVQLKHTLMSRDASLTVTNVTQTDAGKYECYVELSGGKRRKRNVGLKLELLNTINLKIEPGETEKTAEPGEPVLLPCEAEKNVTKVEWRRGNETVCETRNRDDIRCQIVNPSFTNRVHLKKVLKSGDASLILTDVTESDAGKYECYVKLSGGKRRKRDADLTLELSNTVNLKIERGGAKKEGEKAGGDKAGIAGLVTAMIIFLLVAVVLLGFLFYKEHIRRSVLSNNQPAANEAAETQQPLQSP